MTHPGDALSALLDGQLDATEAAAVREHVAGCDACAHELDGVREARRLVRELPAVEPPAGFFERLLDGAEVIDLTAERRRRGRTLATAGAAGTVAAALLLVVVLARPDGGAAAIAPEVAASAQRHEATVDALEDADKITPTASRFHAPGSVPPTTAQVAQVSELPSTFDAPERIAGYELVEAYAVKDGVHLLYHRGPYALSIFEQPGEPDWDSLPEDGTRLEIAGLEAWRWDDAVADGRLYVIDDDELVVTVVSDEPGDAALDVIAALAGR